jgi:uncharacterized membrane protein
MNRLIEWLLGVDGGFLRRAGDLSVSFAPRWPFSDYVGTFTWNAMLLIAAGALVWFLYQREGRSSRARAWLAGLRASLLLLLIVMLNRPQLTLTQSRIEPSVLAVMIDDSMSMRLNDIGVGAYTTTRLNAVKQALNTELLTRLGKTHQLRVYRFSNDALQLETAAPATQPSEEASDAPPIDPARAAAEQIQFLQATGGQTRVVGSLQTVARELQGQRVAGALLLTDGRETEAQAAESTAALRELGTKVYAVPVGTDVGLRNLEIDSLAVQDSVFSGDIVNVKVSLRGTGVPTDVPVKLVLKDAAGVPILENGKPVEALVNFPGDGVQEAELQFIPQQTGPMDIQVEAVPITGEIDDADNARVAQMSVLDANLRVLYVEGYPRWEYRYLKQELIRDPSIIVSCLLTSADASFAQEGDLPITRFPETLEELMEYDVVLLGDVDPRQFTDSQLQLINEFVSRRGGGLGMVAGIQFSPQKYRNTAIEPLLPVDITRVETDSVASPQTLAEGFRISLTQEGKDSSIFRFFRDAQVNQDFLAGKIQSIFWYARGATVKPGVGQVLAQHPRDTGPDGRPAALLVLGRFGTGRTLFSAIDDSWRWRYYTGEQIFNSYWVQSLRYLARGKKLGQRKLTFSSERPVYQLGESARLNVRVLDPQLLTQLGDELRVQVVDDRGQVVRDLNLLRRSGQGDAYTGGFTADRLGRFSVRLASPAAGVEELQTPIEVAVPRRELNDPKVDRPTLQRLADTTGGRVIELKDLAQAAALIPSAQKDIPQITNSPLGTAPLALVLFTFLITSEWILRKRQGLV